MSAPPAEQRGPARLAAVLAGGASTRMGTAKATLELAGRPLIERPIAAARAAGLDPFVVAKGGSPLPALDCPVLSEPDLPRHPLVGVIAALEHADAAIVVLPCDAPLVPPELIAALAAAAGPFAIPIYPRPQPLVALYSPVLLPALRAGLEGAASLTSIATGLDGERLGEQELRQFGDPEWMFANANDEASLARIEAELDRR